MTKQTNQKLTKEQEKEVARYQAAYDFSLQINKELDAFKYRVIGIEAFTERIIAHVNDIDKRYKFHKND